MTCNSMEQHDSYMHVPAGGQGQRLSRDSISCQYRFSSICSASMRNSCRLSSVVRLFFRPLGGT